MKKYLPYILIIILLAGVAIFWFNINKKNQPNIRPVVDMSLPIEKSAGETNNITVPYAGGTRERVQVKFTWKAGDMSYSDALYFSPEEYAKLTTEDIEKLKMERMKNWAETVNAGSREE